MHKVNIKKNNMYGIGFAILHLIAFATLYVLMKNVSKDLSTNLIVFLYKFFVLIAVTIWIFKGGFNNGFKILNTPKLHLHIIRSFFSLGGSLLVMYGFAHVDLVDGQAIKYIEQIITFTIGCVLFKEQINKTKAFAILISIIGMFVVIYPNLLSFKEGSLLPEITKQGFNHFNHYYFFILLSAIFFSCNNVSIKMLGKTERSKVQLFYVMLFSCIMAWPIAFLNWNYDDTIHISLISWQDHGIKLYHFKYIIMMSMCYFSHGILFFKALQYGDLSVISPIEYFKLVILGLMAYIFLGEEVEHYASYIGYSFIIIAGIVLVYSENKKQKKQVKKQIDA